MLVSLSVSRHLINVIWRIRYKQYLCKALKSNKDTNQLKGWLQWYKVQEKLLIIF
jgi:hypothetical protein